MAALEGNNLVMNAGLNPLEGFHFMLRVEAVFDLPCKSVRGFTKKNEYEYIQEGGLNDYVHMRRKPVSEPFTFEVERYVAIDYIDPLPNGAELVLPVILMVSHEGGNFKTAVSRTYTFTGCTVTGKQYGQLDSEKSDLLLETTTIAYRELVVVDIPRNRQLPLTDGQLVKDMFKKAQRLENSVKEVTVWDPKDDKKTARAARLENTNKKVEQWDPKAASPKTFAAQLNDTIKNVVSWNPIATPPITLASRLKNGVKTVVRWDPKAVPPVTRASQLADTKKGTVR